MVKTCFTCFLNIRFCSEIENANTQFFLVFNNFQYLVEGAVERSAEREHDRVLIDFHSQYYNEELARIVMSQLKS